MFRWCVILNARLLTWQFLRLPVSFSYGLLNSYLGLRTSYFQLLTFDSLPSTSAFLPLTVKNREWEGTKLGSLKYEVMSPSRVSVNWWSYVERIFRTRHKAEFVTSSYGLDFSTPESKTYWGKWQPSKLIWETYKIKLYLRRLHVQNLVLRTSM